VKSPDKNEDHKYFKSRVNAVSDLKMKELVPKNKDMSEGIKKIYQALLKHKQSELSTSLNASNFIENEINDAYNDTNTSPLSIRSKPESLLSGFKNKFIKNDPMPEFILPEPGIDITDTKASQLLSDVVKQEKLLDLKKQLTRHQRKFDRETRSQSKLQ
jgi:hypothetical protein